MIRVGRGRRLTWSSRSKFKAVGHQFSTVQFPSHRVCLESSFSSVRGTGAKCLRSVRLVQFSSFSSRTLPAPTMVLNHMKPKAFFACRFWPKSDKVPRMVPVRFCSRDKSADAQHAYFEHDMTSCDLDLSPVTQSHMGFSKIHNI